MTDPIQPRPQPVVIAGEIAGNVVGVVTGLAGLLAILGAATHWAWALGGAAALATVAAGLGKFMPAITAAGAAAQVTPLSDPRDHQLNKLEADPDTYGRHAAKVTFHDATDEIQQALTDPDLAERVAAVRREMAKMDRQYANRTDTQEIPRVTARRLGRKPPTNAPRIKLTASMIPAAAYTPPPTVDWYSKVPAQTWGMDGNDKYGDCTCAEVDHSTKARQVAAGNTEVKSTEAEVLALYSAVAGFNPNKPSTDQGAVMQDVRDYWRKSGVILGNKLDKLTLFAAVDHTDHTLIKWCISRFGAIGVGFNFPDFAMQQFDNGQPWDVVKGAPRPTEGHAVSAVGYDDTYVYTLSWGQVQKMTWAFWDAYVEEVWADLSADWINAQSGQDPLGEVAYALGEQFAQVTGKPNPFPAPAPTPEPPAPTPGPAPTPAPALTADVSALMARILKRKGSPKEDIAVAKEWQATQ